MPRTNDGVNGGTGTARCSEPSALSRPRAVSWLGELDGWLVTATVFLGCCASAIADSNSTVVYVTRNHSLADLEISMTAYYDELKSSKRMPVQNVEDDLGAPVQALVFGMGLLRGNPAKPIFPTSMDRLLCSMNSRVCSLRADGKAIWTNKKGDAICLPDVSWTDGMRFTRVVAPPAKLSNEALQKQLEGKFGTCSALHRECADATEEFRKTLSTDGTMETVVLAQVAHKDSTVHQPITSCSDAPASLASTKLTPAGWKYLQRLRRSPPEGNLGLPSVQTRMAALSEAGRLLLVTPTASGAAPTVSHMLAELGDKELAVPAATGGTLETTRGEAASGAPAPPVRRPDPINNDVFAKADLVTYRDAPIPKRSVRVLVFDWPVNGCHIVLQQAISGLSQCPPQAFSTWQILAAPLDPDHGNHVAALIGGSFGVGIDPNVVIVPVVILGEGVTRFTDAINDAITDQLGRATPDTRIANFSVDLRPDSPHTTDTIGETIDARRGMLFVAAAGNVEADQVPASLDDSCQVVPACARPSQPLGNNLIVVGGASPSAGGWVVWPRSRFGKRVDILAPAESIESAVQADGVLGRMSGSSQSAAIVSGLAARLFQGPLPEVDDWGGAQVKNRLIGTARFFPSLRAFTRSGVVDADRALDIDNQVIVVEKDHVRTQYEGKVLGVLYHGRPSGTDIPFEVPPRGTTVDFCRIYRLSRSGDSQWIVAFQPVSQTAAARWSQLELDYDVVLRTSEKLVEFQPKGQPSIQIPINGIVEFYDRFSGELACRSRSSGASQ